jgi:hypothetical protein
MSFAEVQRRGRDGVRRVGGQAPPPARRADVGGIERGPGRRHGQALSRPAPKFPMTDMEE